MKWKGKMRYYNGIKKLLENRVRYCFVAVGQSINLISYEEGKNFHINQAYEQIKEFLKAKEKSYTFD